MGDPQPADAMTDVALRIGTESPEAVLLTAEDLQWIA